MDMVQYVHVVQMAQANVSLWQVPKERLLAVALGHGPTGATLDLRHEQRAQPSSMDEVGRILTNLCQTVPQVCQTPFLHRKPVHATFT
jgi:hypothetical protein